MTSMAVVAPAPRPLNARLMWPASVDAGWVTNYVIGYGAASRSYTNFLDNGTATSGTVSNLVRGQKYYLAVAAVNQIGVRGPWSAEAVFPPAQTNVITVAVLSSGKPDAGFTNFLTATFTNPPAQAQFFRLGISSTNLSSAVLQMGTVLVVTNETN